MKRLFVYLTVLALLVGGGVFGGVLLWARHQASLIELKSLDPAGATVVLAANGDQIGKIASAEAGKPLEAKQVPILIRHAHMAAEDRSFYAHGAISLKGMAWAMLTNAREGTLAAGGSTITQQLAKKYAGNEKTISRKIDELPYAYRIEQDYTKDEILVTYCNVNFYGRGAYGIADAAQTWFGVSATRLADMNDPLQVARAAFLASLVKQPSNYDDYKGEPRNLIMAKELRERTIYVLDGLRDLEGLPATADTTVSQEVVDKAKGLIATNLDALKITNRFKTTGIVVKGDPHIMNYVRDWLTAWQIQIAREDGKEENEATKIGQTEAEALLARGGLKIQTDIDLGAQTRLTNAHKNRLGGGPSGFIVLNPRTGGVVAMSGSRDYEDDPHNYAIYAKRPPGSTMKPFVLANVVSEGISVKSVFAAPREIRIDGPPIWDHTRKDAPGCKMTLADSLAVSNNVVAVEAATGRMASCDDRNKLTKIKDYPVSPKTVADLIRRAGAEASMVPDRTDQIKVGEEPRLAIGASLEISPLKLAVMASTLANGGEYHKPHLVSRIDAPNGENIFEHEDESQRVIDAEYANIVNRVLTGVFTNGTASGARVEGHPLAGKTGTTDTDLGDAWFFAYNAVNPKQAKEPAYVCSGWAGKNANRHGSDVAEVCQGFFQGQLKGRPGVNFPDADLNAGKLVGIQQPAPPPPPVETTQQPEPSKTTQPEATPTKTKTKKPPTTPTTTSSQEPSPTPTGEPTTPDRDIPPPEENGGNEGDPNDGTVPIPTG